VIPSVPKNVHHHTNCPGTISFEGTAFTWRGSDYCCVQIASNFFATIVFPSCPVPKSGFAFGSENPSNKTSTFGHRPTLLSFTQRKSISANFIPAVNDRPVEWRTCRPDQTSRFVQLASSPLPEIQTLNNCPVCSAGVHHFLIVRFRKFLFRRTVFSLFVRFQEPASLPTLLRASQVLLK